MSNFGDAFNLLVEPWLPVRRRSGVIEHIEPSRITDRIDEDPIVAFAWPRPDFNGTAHELLIGLLATAVAPRDEHEWENWWDDPPTPDILDQRLSKIACAFELAGCGPRFLQDLDPLEGAKIKNPSTLLVGAPGAHTLKNNADLFVKRSKACIFSRATAAMALFTLQSHAPSGGTGHRTSLRGGGPMTTLVIADHPKFGRTLWGRLWPNVETSEQIKERRSDTAPTDAPERIFPWLGPARVSGPETNGRKTTPVDVHPLQVYWGMPRRIRLQFEEAEGRLCSLTGTPDVTVVASYRTINYGTNYSEGFQHPLTPYYRKESKAQVKLPMHPNSGGTGYRLWLGTTVSSKDGLCESGRMLRHWIRERNPRTTDSTSVAFGYEMDNMKARAWMEGEIPLLCLDEVTRSWVERFIERAVAGADTVGQLLTDAVTDPVKFASLDHSKKRFKDRLKGAPRNYGFIAERLFRDTEDAFHATLRELVPSITTDPDSDRPVVETLQSWATIMAKAALRLFDEYAPADGLENRNMYQHVKARFQLTHALGGHGRKGKSLFEDDLGIPSPEITRSRRRKRKMT